MLAALALVAGTISPVSVEEQPQAPSPEPEEDSGEDAYEDWSPKKN